jgi:hypothetical protein
MYIAVSPEVLQQLDLTQGALGEDLLAEHIGDLLNGNALARLVVGRGAHNAVGALAQLLGHIVPLVNDKFLVEDLEDLAVREVRHGGGRGSSCWCSELDGAQAAQAGSGAARGARLSRQARRQARSQDGQDRQDKQDRQDQRAQEDKLICRLRQAAAAIYGQGLWFGGQLGAAAEIRV